MKPIIVRVSIIVRIFAIMAVLVCLILEIIAVLESSMNAAVIGLFFGVAGIVLWVLAQSSMRIDDKGVTVRSPGGTYQIAWEEMKKIEYNLPMIAFWGEDKRVVISLKTAGENTEAVLDLIQKQAQARKIQIGPGFFPMTHLNSKVHF